MGLLGSDSNIYPDPRSRTHPIHGPLRFFFVSRAPVLLAGCMLPLIWGRRLLWVFSASTRLRYVSSQGPPISSQLAVASSLRSEWASAGNRCGSSGQAATRRDASVGRLCETPSKFCHRPLPLVDLRQRCLLLAHGVVSIGHGELQTTRRYAGIHVCRDLRGQQRRCGASSTARA